MASFSIRSFSILVALFVMFTAGHVYAACPSPNPNLTATGLPGNPFVDGCPLPAGGLNNAFGLSTGVVPGTYTCPSSVSVNMQGKITAIFTGNCPTFPNSTIVTGNGSSFGNMAVGSGLSVTGTFPNQTLTATGTSLTIPNASLINGNGTALGSVALGTNLSLTGSFPNQTLNAAGGGGGSGITANYTVASSCTGASCSPATQCWAIVSGSISSITTGACTMTASLVGRNGGGTVGRNGGGSVARN